MSHRDSGRDAEAADYFDGGGIEDYEDSTRAIRPSEAGQEVYAEEHAYRLVDMLIAKWRCKGVPFRVIALILNRDESVLVRRYGRMPERARRFYERFQLA